MAKRSKAKKRSTSKRSRSRRTAKSKTKGKPNLLVYVLLVVVVVFALAFSIPSGNNGLGIGTGSTGPTWGEQTTGTTTGTTGTTGQQSEYPCKSNSECFAINCKETPANIECVNAIALETYGRDNCNNYNSVDVDQDLMICRCMGGFCTLDK